MKSVAEQVKDALESLAANDVLVEVDAEGDRNIVARVVWPGFSAWPEEERQGKIWFHLRSKLSDEDLTRVDFVFTSTPDEQKREAEATLEKCV